ncbi:MAG TPA: GNAT family N-acetyltransferase [Gemmatimonadales bacterium]|nr:GNAT family N-acetyltransferase [Gemmatimonadales bacterium]
MPFTDQARRAIARDCSDEAEWDGFVREIPWATAHHALRYGTLLARSFGYLRPIYRLIERDGRPVGGIPLMRFDAAGIWTALHSLPFDIYGGPLIHPDHLDDPDLHRGIAAEIDALAARCRAFEVRFSIPVTAPPALRRCLIQWGGRETKVSDCPVLDLDAPLDAIRRGYRPELRRALRASDREGISIAADAPLEHVRQLYGFYRDRMKQIGATVKPWRFTEGILQQRIGIPFVAYRTGAPVGFLVLLPAPRIAIYWISAFDPRASRARPMSAMLDAAIGWAHGRGIARFSFGESHGRPGLERFKDGFGPAHATHSVVVRAYRPAAYHAWHALEPVARRSYAVWDGGRTALRARTAPPPPPLIPRAEPDPAWTAHLAGRRVLVTGATGFIGQHLVRVLRQEPNVSIRILVRSLDRARQTFGPAVAALEVHAGDLTAPDSLRGLCADVDLVLHSGSAVPYAFAGAAPPGEFARVNVGGTENLLVEAAAAGVRQLVVVSSTAAMGTPREPTVDERTPCRPAAPYQLSKHRAEQALLRAHRERGLDVRIIRPCLVAGEGKRGGELLKLFRLCRRGVFPVIGGSLEVEKPLVDVEDVVQALLLASRQGQPGEVYLVHSDGGHTLGGILREAGRLLGRRKPYIRVPLALARAGAHLGPPLARLVGRGAPLTPERLDLFLAHRHIDVGKARAELGFVPRHQDLSAMLGRTFHYYVATGQL